MPSDPVLERDIYDLMRMTKAADVLLANADDDQEIHSAAQLLVEKATEMAKALDETYQSGSLTRREFPDSDRVLTAKAEILAELAACESRLRETRTEAEAQPQAGAAEAQSSQAAVTRYLNLEEPIRFVKYMAGIAHDLAYDLLGLEETPETEEIILRLSDRERNQLFFAINKVRAMAKELDELYHRQHVART